MRVSGVSGGVQEGGCKKEGRKLGSADRGQIPHGTSGNLACRCDLTVSYSGIISVAPAAGCRILLVIAVTRTSEATARSPTDQPNHISLFRPAQFRCTRVSMSRDYAASC